MGRKHAITTMQHVHLYVNGEYMGVYLLTDERDVSPGRLEINWHENPARSGFFIELDNRAPWDGTENETFVTVNSLHYDIRFPSGTRRTPEHVTYLREYLEAVSYAIRYQSFDEILELIDLDSFVDFYIVQEFYRNKDVHFLSVFMYITGEGRYRRLHMGPAWDFDTAAGNAETQWLGSGTDGLYAAVFNYWYRNLMSRPEFFEAVATRWNEIRRTAIPQTIAHVNNTATRYRNEFERNFERHPTPPTFLRQEIQAIETFMGQAEHLTAWLEARAAWLTAFFNGEFPDYCHMWTLVEFTMYDSPVNVQINGRHHEFTTIPPIILQNVTKITLQEVAEIFDLTISYNAEVATLTKDRTTILHRINRHTFSVNGEIIKSTAPSVTIKGYTFVPLRTIAEALNYDISWIESTRTVVLTAN
jgi:hypothetical protein